MTVAMSMLIHGEAVRFNRGQSTGDDFDFKYLRGRDGSVFPYVSSQCYKKYWRESLPEPFSPIIREKSASGKEKNQAFTSGDPVSYVDDDLFGYMVAGATEADDGAGGSEMPEGGGDAPRVFEAENLKDAEALTARLLDDSPLSKFILGTPGAKEKIQNPESPDNLRETLLDLLDEAARKRDLFGIEGIKGVKEKHKKLKAPGELRDAGREVLRSTFVKELQERKKRDTARRTAPVRMHALVAFSGIKTARDFQTFSRDIAYTPGLNSVMNPARPGIYTGWLKTRILIESQRIGKFHIGKNMDILADRVRDQKILEEDNPYSKDRSAKVQFVQLDSAERTRRLRAALRALANIGNRQGPASGALHDGSLRPKAFVAGFLNCADSPFDYIWTARNDDSMPELDINLLRNSIKDWEDLFATKKIYVGLPTNADLAAGERAGTIGQAPAWETKQMIESELKDIGFEAAVGTPRKALLRLAEEATL